MQVPDWLELDRRQLFGVAAALFFLIFLLHALRVIFRWEAVVDDMHVPIWLSIVFGVVAAYLAINSGHLFLQEAPAAHAGSNAE